MNEGEDVISDNPVQAIQQHEILAWCVQSLADVITSKNLGEFAQVSEVTMSFGFLFDGRCVDSFVFEGTLSGSGCVFFGNGERRDIGKDYRY